MIRLMGVGKMIIYMVVLENDTISGDKGSDRLYGNDILHGGSSVDYLYGGDDIDSLKGSDGSDFLYGGKGTDLLDGGENNDSMYGDEGVDIFLGGSGNDTLYVDLEDLTGMVTQSDAKVFDKDKGVNKYVDNVTIDGGNSVDTIKFLLDSGTVDFQQFETTSGKSKITNAEYLDFDDGLAQEILNIDKDAFNDITGGANELFIDADSKDSIQMHSDFSRAKGKDQTGYKAYSSGDKTLFINDAILDENII